MLSQLATYLSLTLPDPSNNSLFLLIRREASVMAQAIKQTVPNNNNDNSKITRIQKYRQQWTPSNKNSTPKTGHFFSTLAVHWRSWMLQKHFCLYIPQLRILLQLFPGNVSQLYLLGDQCVWDWGIKPWPTAPHSLANTYLHLYWIFFLNCAVRWQGNPQTNK